VEPVVVVSGQPRAVIYKTVNLRSQKPTGLRLQTMSQGKGDNIYIRGMEVRNGQRPERALRKSNIFTNECSYYEY
jgi:hypothetical protein